MKTIIYTLLATLAITLTASASQKLLVETTITEHHAEGGKDVMTAPSITVESGKQAIIKIGKLEYAVTPTLLDDSTVEISAILTEHNGTKADQLAVPKIKAELEKVAEIKIGQIAFTTKTSLVK